MAGFDKIFVFLLLFSYYCGEPEKLWAEVQVFVLRLPHIDFEGGFAVHQPECDDFVFSACFTLFSDGKYAGFPRTTALLPRRIDKQDLAAGCLLRARDPAHDQAPSVYRFAEGCFIESSIERFVQGNADSKWIDSASKSSSRPIHKTREVAEQRGLFASVVFLRAEDVAERSAQNYRNDEPGYL